jgi:hypothetical protein
MKGRKRSPEEVSLLPTFDEEELAARTPGEHRLLVALEHEELPEQPAAEARRVQQKYRARLLDRTTVPAKLKAGCEEDLEIVSSRDDTGTPGRLMSRDVDTFIPEAAARKARRGNPRTLWDFMIERGRHLLV